MPLRKNWGLKVLLAVGLLACGAGIRQYALSGFSAHLWVYWLVGCFSLLIVAFQTPAIPMPEILNSNKKIPGIVRRDWLVAGVILLIFTPVYLFNTHNFPRQMNTDEIAVMATAKTLAAQPDLDIVAPSYYADLPTFIFWAFGKLGMLLGGVTLGNMRFVHAASGLLGIVLIFLLLRMLKLPRYAAVAGACAVGLNHSLFFLSRMALRDNTAMLFEVTTLLLLLYGWQRRSYAWTLLGGFAAGMTFYTYYPSRITIVIWLAFVVAATIGASFKDWKTALNLTLTALIGLIIIAAPLYIATSRHIQTNPYASHQFLWQKEAQEQERAYRGVATIKEALKINMIHGLLAYNGAYADQGMLYNHPGYGFSDKVTGVILWLGIIVVLLRSLYRKRINENDLLALGGFLITWLSLAFLLTRAPDYTRLLITLPFVAYMIGQFTIGAVGLTRKLYRRRFMAGLPWIITAIVVLGVGISNGFIIRDFQVKGNRDGDGVGDTLRFQEKHTAESIQWLFVPGQSTNYFYWGIQKDWDFWLKFGMGQSQYLQILTAQDLTSGNIGRLPYGAKGYLLTTNDIWDQAGQAFSQSKRVLSAQPLDRANNRFVITYTEY